MSKLRSIYGGESWRRVSISFDKGDRDAYPYYAEHNKETVFEGELMRMRCISRDMFERSDKYCWFLTDHVQQVWFDSLQMLLDHLDSYSFEDFYTRVVQEFVNFRALTFARPVDVYLNDNQVYKYREFLTPVEIQCLTMEKVKFMVNVESTLKGLKALRDECICERLGVLNIIDMSTVADSSESIMDLSIFPQLKLVMMNILDTNRARIFLKSLNTLVGCEEIVIVIGYYYKRSAKRIVCPILEDVSRIEIGKAKVSVEFLRYEDSNQNEDEMDYSDNSFDPNHRVELAHVTSIINLDETTRFEISKNLGHGTLCNVIELKYPVLTDLSRLNHFINLDNITTITDIKVNGLSGPMTFAHLLKAVPNLQNLTFTLEFSNGIVHGSRYFASSILNADIDNLSTMPYYTSGGWMTKHLVDSIPKSDFSIFKRIAQQTLDNKDSLLEFEKELSKSKTNDWGSYAYEYFLEKLFAMPELRNVGISFAAIHPTAPLVSAIKQHAKLQSLVLVCNSLSAANKDLHKLLMERLNRDGLLSGVVYNLTYFESGKRLGVCYSCYPQL